jgi:la-related protein 1
MPMVDGSGPLPPSLPPPPPQAPPGSSVGGYYNPPPRQQQHLAGYFQLPPGGFDPMYGVAPHQGAMPQQPHLNVAGSPVSHISSPAPAPLPAPLSTISFPLDTTRYYLLGQLEYYLSPQNMAQDFYLRKQVGFFILSENPFFNAR